MFTPTPFIKWGSFPSHDQNNPDVLDLKVLDREPFETSLSINVEVLQKVDGKWEERILPLKSHDSENASLLNQWKKELKKRKLSVGMLFQIRTWLSTSKNDRPIRRFSLDF